MTRHAPQPHAAPQGDAPRQLAQLRQLLLLVERIAGGRDRADVDAALDEAARIGAAYGEALPVLRRRVDALTAETSAWAAAGVEALSRCGGSPAAAARLADELKDALDDLAKLLNL
ncbi:MAG TPA: hypothetical protein VF603_13955 [Allosphingosinicella sp.]|jgi:hypothetical protein